MTSTISGKVVVITGASSGLGEATARHLAGLGADVVLGARRVDRLASIAADLSLPAGATLATDVTRLADVSALVDRAVDLHGRIDVMVNNAGLAPLSLLERLKVDEWDQMIDVNVKGVLYGIAAALPHMQRQKSGHFVNVSSVAGHKVRPTNVVYAATKTAVRVLSEGLRMEVKPYGIRTTIISPGAIATELPLTTTDPEVSARGIAAYEAFAIAPDAFARAVAYAIGEPQDVDINEILLRPTIQEL